MKHTTNYSLSQYDATDRVTRSTFNSDNSKIDAAIKNAANAAASAQSTANSAQSAAASAAKIATGTYVGTGTYGAGNPVTLTFSSTPKLLYVRHETISTRFFWAYYGLTTSFCTTNGSDPLNLTWGSNSLSWVNNSALNGHQQMNDNGSTYYYIAFF